MSPRPCSSDCIFFEVSSPLLVQANNPLYQKQEAEGNWRIEIVKRLDKLKVGEAWSACLYVFVVPMLLVQWK